MKIYSIGYNHPHDKYFCIDRPGGTSNWLLLLIKTPAIFRQDNKEIVTKKNSFILYTDSTPQYYKAYGNEYIDDWFHFSVNDEEKKLVDELNIPLNTVTEIFDITELSSIVRNMTYEFYSKNIYKNEIMDLSIRMILYKLSQILSAKTGLTTEISSIYYDRMQNLRNNIYNTPEVHRTVDEMAENLSMSRSGFQHTYKKIFGVGVSEDIINSRLQKVKFYLSTTEMTLSDIAELCGYNNEIYLMRQFKKKFGITPTEFRRCL